jgi:hypothetical protein
MSDNIKYPRCLNGLRRNKKTHICEAIKTRKKAKATRKRCQNGKVKNPKTTRCIKKETLKKTMDKKKELKLRNIQSIIHAKHPTHYVKTNTQSKSPKQKRTICPNGTISDPVSKICAARTNGNSIRVNRPSINAQNAPNLVWRSEPSLIQYEYTPSLNKNLLDFTTMTLRKDLNDCPKNKVKVKQSNGKYKCVTITSDAAQEQMLKFLNRSRNISCITAPKQRQSNCWFNTMFMALFISDEGYRYTKIIRQIMITGKRIGGTSIDKNLRLPFLNFNLAIQASIDCTEDTYYLLDDTNIILEQITRLIPQKPRMRLPKPGENGNPIPYYKTVVEYLLNDYNNIKHFQHLMYNYFVSLQANEVKNFVSPDILLVSVDYNNPMHVRMLKQFPKKTTITLNNKHVYKLDSIIISNDIHFISFHTINNNEYAFDGATYSKAFPMAWKNKLNTNKNFNLYQGKRSVKDWKFNFVEEYQILFYYRVK